MVKIYTKTGDKGKTNLFDCKIPKSSKILTLLNLSDLIISKIGLFFLSDCEKIQSELMCFNTWVSIKDSNNNNLSEKKKLYLNYKPNINFLEEGIDLLTKENEKLNKLNKFILPNHSLHEIRVLVRMLECKLWKQVNELEHKPNFFLWAAYLNRLSDYCYAKATILQQDFCTWDHPKNK